MTFAIRPSAVTLNLFQGPFLRALRSFVARANRSVDALFDGPVRAAQLMLKRVQHDGVCGERVA